jgi:hypothetical protein
MARHEWKDVASGLEVDAELTGRFAAAEARVTARDTAARTKTVARARMRSIACSSSPRGSSRSPHAAT